MTVWDTRGIEETTTEGGVSTMDDRIPQVVGEGVVLAVDWVGMDLVLLEAETRFVLPSLIPSKHEWEAMTEGTVLNIPAVLWGMEDLGAAE